MALLLLVAACSDDPTEPADGSIDPTITKAELTLEVLSDDTARIVLAVDAVHDGGLPVTVNCDARWVETGSWATRRPHRPVPLTDTVLVELTNVYNRVYHETCEFFTDDGGETGWEDRVDIPPAGAEG